MLQLTIFFLILNYIQHIYNYYIFIIYQMDKSPQADVIVQNQFQNNPKEVPQKQQVAPQNQQSNPLENKPPMQQQSQNIVQNQHSISEKQEEPIDNIQQQAEIQKLEGYFKKNKNEVIKLMEKQSGGTNIINFARLKEFLRKLLPSNKIQIITTQNKNVIEDQDQHHYQLENKIIEYLTSTMQQEEYTLQKTEFNLKDIKFLFGYLIAKDHLKVYVYDQTDQNQQEQILEKQQITQRIAENQENKQYSNNVDQNKKILKLELSHEQINRHQSIFDLRQELLQTISKYQTLLQNQNLSLNQRKVLNQTLETIKQQLNELNHNQQFEQKPIQQNEVQTTNQKNQNYDVKSHLQIIFQYYCKQTYSTGKNPTFQRIKYQSNILTLTKFMIFCRDFEFIGKHIKLNDLQEIFKKCASMNREMNFQQFGNCLQKISQKIFDGQDLSSDPLLCLKKLYELMEIDTENKFKVKVKNLHIPFTIKDKKKIYYKESEYKFKYISHGGKLAEQIKNFIQQKKKLKNIQKNKDKTNPEKKKVNKNTHSSHLNLPPQQQLVSFGRPVQLMPLNQVSQLPQSDIPKIDTSKRITGITRGGATGYSEIYKNKHDLKRISKQSYKLNNIVQQAKNYVRKQNPNNSSSQNNEIEYDQQQQQKQQKINLDDLIQDDYEEDDYLKQHWRMEESSKQSISVKLSDRINEIKKIELEKDKRLNKIASINMLNMRQHQQQI